MKRIILLTICLVVCQNLYAQKIDNPSLLFQENNGQVVDQNQQLRRDVLFYGNADAMSYFLKKEGVSYQLYKAKASSKSSPYLDGDLLAESHHSDSVIVQRLDIEWLNTDSNLTIATATEYPSVSNYYLGHCPNGILDVKSYAEVIYQGIYPGIDLKYYKSNNSLKYDFVVYPEGDPKDIKMLVKGATSITENEDGSLSISTPIGTVIEGVPEVFQEGKMLPANWIVKGDELTLNISSYDRSKVLTIDPVVRIWGGYYGSIGLDGLTSCKFDGQESVYLGGLTKSTSNIATNGAFQTLLAGDYDALLVKTDTAGHRKWATYYGGSMQERLNRMSLTEDDIYICGYTISSNFPVSGNAFQTVLNGTQDAMVVKFDSMGHRQWASLYGGSMHESFNDLVVDSNYLYLVGSTASTDVIATGGSFQNALNGLGDAFVAKFDTSFNRIWSTYFGGNNGESGVGVIKLFDKVYLYGFTNSTSGLATPGAHQSTYGGNALNDAYLAQFDVSGNRIWCTYHGTTAIEAAYTGFGTDSGYVYIGGQQGSGAMGGFVAKFDTSGSNIWFHYPPGVVEAMCLSATNTIIACGATNQTANIASPGSHQMTLNSSQDGFVREITPSGTWISGSYYGGNGPEVINSCVADKLGNIFVAGITESSNGIATTGSYQPVFGGIRDGMFAKFSTCTTPGITISGDTTSCSGAPASYTALATIANGTFQWRVNNIPVGTNSLTYSYYPVNGDQVACDLMLPASVCYSNTLAVSNTLTVNVKQTLQPTVSLSGPSGAGVGMPVTIYASITNPPAVYSIDWIRNGIVFNTTSANFVTYTKTSETDTIAALLIPLSECFSDATSTTHIVATITNVGELKKQHITLYPNPCDDAVVIEGVEQGDHIRVTDMMGRHVCSWKGAKATGSYQTHDLQTGFYILRVTDAENNPKATLLLIKR